MMRVDFFDMAQALARQQIDAFLSGEPFPTMAVRDNIGRILSYPYFGESIGTINGGMITTRDMVQRRSEIVQALVTAHAKATQYLNNHQDEWIRRASDFGYSEGLLRAAAKNIVLSWDIDDEMDFRVAELLYINRERLVRDRG